MERLLQGAQRLVQAAAQRGDIVFAVLIIAVVFVLILPLPTMLLDVLIALNIGTSALLLMVAMYLPSPLSFSSFPSVLLITTLFRLSLSIASTRLILLQADAGHIIAAFGNFVVGGNLVVGLVIFLILTVVQFIVVTKGAERVAEVAARFSLDGMPGKQMSIDGDLRAGAIDIKEAQRRRTLVEKESQLYGAMDGAMKFVKGDAIASIVIIVVNLIGGLLIGTFQRDMAASEAMKMYSILTVGDGLIAQIPALLIAITAGMIVTRVTATDGAKSNIGRDISIQILAQPQALLIAAAILLGFGIVPGMPGFIFATGAAAAGSVGFVMLRGARMRKKGAGVVASETAAPGAVSDDEQEGEGGKEGSKFVLTAPLMMDVSDDLQAYFDSDMLNRELADVRQALYLELGVPFPGIQLRYNRSLPEQTYALLVNEVPVSQGFLRPDCVLVRETTENLETLGVPYLADKQFLPNIPTLWVETAHLDAMQSYGLRTMTPVQILAHHVAVVLKRYAHEFIGVQETRYLLSQMEPKYPDLIKELQRIMPAQKIGEILQRLVSESISIRNLRAIAEAMVEWGQKEKDAVLLTEHIRTALKRQVSFQFSRGQPILPAYLLAPPVEDTIRNAIRQTSVGSYLALDPELTRRILANIKEVVGDLSRVNQMPVLLTNMDIRRYVRKMIEEDLFELPVLSFQELSREIHVQPLARVELSDAKFH